MGGSAKGIGGPEWLLCIEKTGEINLRIGRNDEGISLFNKILPFVKDNRRKANLYMQLCIAFFKKGDWKMCEANAKVGLALLGESLPTSGPAFALSILREALVHLLHNFIPALGSRAPRKESRPEQSMIVWFYLRLCYAYLLGNGLKYFLRSTLRMLNICESKIGPSRDLGMAMAGYASLCMAIPLFRPVYRVLPSVGRQCEKGAGVQSEEFRQIPADRRHLGNGDVQQRLQRRVFLSRGIREEHPGIHELA